MTTQNLQIAAVDNDDGWTFVGGGQNSNQLNACGHFSGQGGCDIWARFKVTTTIAQNSTITSAIFRQQGYTPDSTPGFSARVKLQLTSNAGDFVSGADLDGRTYCTDKPTISNPSIVDGVDYDVDITTAFQQLINTYALTANNYIMVTVEDQSSSSGVYRAFKSQNNSSAVGPRLNLTYTDPPVSITATAAGVFSVTGALKTFKEVSAAPAGVFTVAGSIVNTRELTATAAVSIGVASPDRWFIYFPGWLGIGGEFAFDSFGEYIGVVVWDGVDPNTLVSGLQAALDITPVTNNGMVTASLISGSEPVTVQVVYKNGPGGLNTATNVPEWTALDVLGPSTPTINVINDGGKTFNNVTRQFTATAAVMFTTSTPSLVNVGVQLTATAAAVFNTPAALLSLLLPVTAAPAATFTTSSPLAGVKRPLTSAPAAVFTVGPSQLGTKVFVTASTAAVFITSSPAWVNYCRLFSRAQFITYITAHPDFIRPLNAAAAAAFTTSAPELQFKRLMTATATVSWTTAGNVVTVRSVTAAPAAVFTVSGVAGMPIHATAEAAAVFVTTSPLSDTHRAFTALAAATFETGEPLAVMPLTATASPVFAVSAAFSVKKRVTATSAAVFAPVAFAGVKKAVSANPSSLFTVTAAATFTHPITATAVLTVLVTATQNTYKQFTAAVAGSFQTNQPLMKVGLRITATAAAVFDLPSTPGTIHKLFTSTAAGSFTPVAFPSVKRNFSASISFDVLPLGSISVTRSISSQADAVFSIAGIITNRRLLTANPTGIFQTVAALDVFRGLSARVDSRFIVRHLPLEVNPLDLADIWKLPPRDWVFVLPGSDQ